MPLPVPNRKEEVSSGVIPEYSPSRARPSVAERAPLSSSPAARELLSLCNARLITALQWFCIRFIRTAHCGSARVASCRM